MTRRRSHRGRRLLGAGYVVAVLAGLLLLTPAAGAASEGSIDHVEAARGSLRVLYSVPGLSATTQPDPASVVVRFRGRKLPATAAPADQAQNAVRRTTVLAMDVSRSMAQNNRFGEAKKAALTFLDSAPADLNVGIVTFAGRVDAVQQPTLDRAASRAIIENLKLSGGTLLYDGIKEAVADTGDYGQRNVLVLSDGADTSGSALSNVLSTVKNAHVKLDVVALPQQPQDEAILNQIATAGGGQVLTTADPKALTAAFASEAQVLAQQVLITVDTQSLRRRSEGTLAVSIQAGGQTYSDSAFVSVPSARVIHKTRVSTDLTAPPQVGIPIPHGFMVAGIAAAVIGLSFLVLGGLGLLSGPKKISVEDQIAAYSRRGSRRRAAATAASSSPSVAAQAVGVAEKALDSSRGLDTLLAGKLEAAGMSMKAPEWLLAHAGLAVLGGFVGFLISSGNILWGVLGLFLGMVGPWVYLGHKESRRVKAFKAQLADTLQLMSGSLSAGMSLAQSVDTVVREGADPIASEFKRAIVEARLGVDMEDALQSVADRMKSRDFDWVVMAIRIQREVGGNLAELLNTVAGTIREREYLERQVQALSAEGRLSVWILGGLPPAFMAYLLVANRTYLQPMFHTVIGNILLGVMLVLITVGILWMKKLVKVDV